MEQIQDKVETVQQQLRSPQSLNSKAQSPQPSSLNLEEPPPPSLVTKTPSRSPKSLVKRILQFLHSDRLRVLLKSSLAVTTLLIGVRYLGGLQSMELWAFDRLIRLRSSVIEERPDPRLLVVTIDEDDIRYQDRQGMKRRGSLSDPALSLLLEKLEQYQAKSIGLDMYHDYEFESSELLAQLQQNQHFFTVCKVGYLQSQGISPPKGIQQKAIGFSDVIQDNGGFIRRQLLSLKPAANSHCQTNYSLNFLLALDYLAGKWIHSRVTPEGYLQISDVIFKPIESRTGGYQGVDARGYQLLLNYRSIGSFERIAESVPLQDFLRDEVNPTSVKDKIVLIGVTAPSFGDHNWLTPSGKRIPGVFLHAHMVSQILSAVLDNRSLLWVWPLWREILWVWGWSLVGGFIACCSLRPQNLVLAGSAALAILWGFCFGIFTQAGWVPLIPPALALIATGAAVLVYRKESQ